MKRSTSEQSLRDLCCLCACFKMEIKQMRRHVCPSISQTGTLLVKVPSIYLHIKHQVSFVSDTKPDSISRHQRCLARSVGAGVPKVFGSNVLLLSLLKAVWLLGHPLCYMLFQLPPPTPQHSSTIEISDNFLTLIDEF